MHARRTRPLPAVLALGCIVFSVAPADAAGCADATRRADARLARTLGACGDVARCRDHATARRMARLALPVGSYTAPQKARAYVTDSNGRSAPDSCRA